MAATREAVRTGRSPKEGMESQENHPSLLSRPAALRLLADWLEDGHTARLVCVYGPPTEEASREEVVDALRKVIDAYERANEYRIDQEPQVSQERRLDDYHVNEARAVLDSVRTP